MATAAVRADRRGEGREVLERAARPTWAGRHLPGWRSSWPGPAAFWPTRPTPALYFATALADPAGEQWPFERAQLRLGYAEWLRRRRRINEAKPELVQGAWKPSGGSGTVVGQRAEAELRASGMAITDAPGASDPLAELTPQQRQIVRLAGDGLTNREIGDRLLLSPRTVSSHLYRSFPKLGITDRHQLRDVIAHKDA